MSRPITIAEVVRAWDEIQQRTLLAHALGRADHLAGELRRVQQEYEAAVREVDRLRKELNDSNGRNQGTP